MYLEKMFQYYISKEHWPHILNKLFRWILQETSMYV